MIILLMMTLDSWRIYFKEDFSEGTEFFCPEERKGTGLKIDGTDI
ncbi:hypothetical protein HMPREF3038_02478 [Akkermansia sp. KLE1797]|nr:hypothetical protein HMPREF3038_02478 [Akkermansia sp. KLE1797]